MSLTKEQTMQIYLKIDFTIIKENKEQLCRWYINSTSRISPEDIPPMTQNTSDALATVLLR